METCSGITALIDQLIALFNRHCDDLPDALFDRQTQFVLNGLPFEERVGRPSSDPLVRLLTRGAAGYRFAAKGVRHAVPDAHIQRGEVSEIARDGRSVLTWQCWFSGHLRGTHERCETIFGAEFTLSSSGVVERAAVTIPEAVVARLHEARLRP
jgi:hypothetical protein